MKRAVDDYNRKARAHNARVRSNRRSLDRELSKLRSASRRTTLTVSSQTLHSAYVTLQAQHHGGTLYPEELLALSEKETANSLRASNALAGAADDADEYGDLQETAISAELVEFGDLDSSSRSVIWGLRAIQKSLATS